MQEDAEGIAPEDFDYGVKAEASRSSNELKRGKSSVGYAGPRVGFPVAEAINCHLLPRYTDHRLQLPPVDCDWIGGGVILVQLFVGCLTSQQHASVSHGRICSGNLRSATLR